MKNIADITKIMVWHRAHYFELFVYFSERSEQQSVLKFVF